MKKETKIIVAALASLMIAHPIMYWKLPMYKNLCDLTKFMVSDLDAIKEIPKVLSDLIIEKKPEKKDGFYRIDFHAHINKKENYDSIENWFNTLTEKVDIVVLASHFSKDTNQLSYEEIKQIVSENMGKLEYNDLGKLFSVSDGKKEIYVIKGQEVNTNEGFHAIIFGNENGIDKLMDLEELITLAEENGTVILSHPCSVPRLGLLNKEKEKILLKNAKKVSAIEEFNTSNTLLLFVSNVKARKFAEKYDIATVSGSDMQHVLKKVGTSCTYIKKEKIDLTNEATFFDSLEKAIRGNDNLQHKKYDSLIEFYNDFFNPL